MTDLERARAFWLKWHGYITAADDMKVAALAEEFRAVRLEAESYLLMLLDTYRAGTSDVAEQAVVKRANDALVAVLAGRKP